MRAQPGGPLVGRGAELRVLGGWLAAAGDGTGRPALLQGEAGVGKSRLVTHLIEDATAAGFRVLAGTAEELEQNRPLFPLLTAFPPGSATPARVAELIGRPADPGAEDTGFRAIQLLSDHLENATAAGPVLLVLEDLHWADLATLRALRTFVRDLERRPFAVLATLRDGPQRPELTRVLDRLQRDGALVVRLGALDPDDTVRMATRLLDRAPGPRLAGLIAGTGGNPLLVSELVQALAADGALTVDADIAEVAGTTTPVSLRRAVRRRLAAVAPQTVRMLEFAAVTGASFAADDVAAALDRPVVELLPAIRDGIDAGLLAEDGDRLVFRHALIRDALYAELPVAVRARLHREIGTALARAGAPAGRIAEQFSRAAVTGDREAVQWLRKAAAEAAPCSPGIAAEMLERALELAGDADLAAALTTELVALLGQCGRMADAETLAAKVLGAGPPADQEIAVRSSLASGLVLHRRWADARRHLERVSALATGARRQNALAYTSYAAWFGGDATAAERFADTVLAECAALRDPTGLVEAVTAKAALRAARGAFRPALSWLDDQLSTMEPRGWTRYQQILVGLTRSRLRTSLDEMDAAIDLQQRSCVDAERWGQVAWLPTSHITLAVTLFAAGRWDDAVNAAESSAGLSAEWQTPAAASVWGLLARVALARGDLDTARARLVDADRDGALDTWVFGTPWVRWAAALVHEAEGDQAAAAKAAAEAVTVLPGVRYLEQNWLLVADAVRLLMADGARTAARALTADIEGVAKTSGVPALQGTALRCRGLVDGDAGTLVRAVEALRTGRRPFDLAQACADAAAMLTRAGRAGEAGAFLDEAFVVYDNLGAAQETHRASAAVRRPRRTARRDRPANGWAALTGTELTVAGLVADGLTNARVAAELTVSTHTVAAHLRSIYAKLDIASRATLARDLPAIYRQHR